MGNELVQLTETDFVNEGETPIVRAALTDENGDALTVAGITALTVTNSANGSAVNRNAQDINDTNGGSLVTTKQLAFTSGSERPDVGDTVSGAVSGATGTVSLVVRNDGEWVDGDASGFLYVSSVSGTCATRCHHVRCTTSNSN